MSKPQIIVDIDTIENNLSTSTGDLNSHISNSLNPHSTTAAQVGLGNVTNESKETMFTNTVLTGVPVAPTAVNGTNTTQLATTAFVKQEFSSLTFNIDGGKPSNVYTVSEIINGGNVNGI